MDNQVNGKGIVNGCMTMLLLGYFVFCMLTGNFDAFVAVVGIGGFLWVLFGNLFEWANKGVTKASTLIPAKPKPAILPPPQQTVIAPQVEKLRATEQKVSETKVDTRAETKVEITGDTRKDTVSAIQSLPKSITATVPDNGVIPILYDGVQAHTMVVGRDGHYGIFGISGSGKGNLIRLIATSVLNMGPQNATLDVLDAKGGLDYSFCEDIQHATLYCDDDLTAGTQNILAEMKRRKGLLFKARVENIFQYNKLNPDNPLPFQVVIADELLAFDDDAKDNLSIFATQSRALGGVLIVATQYPTTDVIPSQIQANITNRIVGRLASSEHTRVALRRTKSDNCNFEPSMIPQGIPGVMVIRRGEGAEILGRSPEFTLDVATPFINQVVAKYPKINSTPENGAQSVTGASQSMYTDEAGITTSPLTDGEKTLVNDWEDEGVTRREIARRIYKQRGGKNAGYTGDGMLSKVVREYLDNEA